MLIYELTLSNYLIYSQKIRSFRESDYIFQQIKYHQISLINFKMHGILLIHSLNDQIKSHSTISIQPKLNLPKKFLAISSSFKEKRNSEQNLSSKLFLN